MKLLFNLDDVICTPAKGIRFGLPDYIKSCLPIEDTTEFMIWLKTLSVTPTISDLKGLFEQIKNNELSKIESHYDNKTLAAIDLFSTSLMKKVLKDPISTLKTQASNGSYSPALVDAIRSIYRLDKSLEPAEHN